MSSDSGHFQAGFMVGVTTGRTCDGGYGCGGVSLDFVVPVPEPPQPCSCLPCVIIVLLICLENWGSGSGESSAVAVLKAAWSSSVGLRRLVVAVWYP